MQLRIPDFLFSSPSINIHLRKKLYKPSAKIKNINFSQSCYFDPSLVCEGFFNLLEKSHNKIIEEV